MNILLITMNTIEINTPSRVAQSLALLELLGSAKGHALLQCLLEQEVLSFVELSIHTGWDTDVLDYHLQQFYQMRLIQRRRHSDKGEYYEVNRPYLRQIAQAVRQLAALYH